MAYDKNTLYYFNNKGVLQKGKTVGEYQLDKITGAAIKIATEPDTSEVTDESNTTGGDADNTATTVNKLHIFVGDSRTVGLSNAMGCVSYDKLLQIRTEENLTSTTWRKSAVVIPGTAQKHFRSW